MVEEIEHGGPGGIQAIEVQAVKTKPLRPRRLAVIVLPQPANEVKHVRVAPHPGGKALEIREGLDGFLVVALALEEAIDPISVRPVGLDGHGGEAFFPDQAFGDLRPGAIELVSSVRRFSKQDETRVADQLQQRVVVGGSAGQRVSGLANHFGAGHFGHVKIVGFH